MLAKKEQKKIASERINILFEQAIARYKKNISLSNRYVKLARKLSMRYKVKILREYKKLFCKKCYTYLLPGKTLRARVKDKKLIYYCLNCKKITRYPFSRKT